MITYSQLGKNGRFGNQLFQIASTIGIARDLKVKYGFPEWEYQKYFKNKLPSNFNVVGQKVRETSTGYYDRDLNPILDYDLQGYLQSYKYFDKHRELIDYYFQPNDEVVDSLDLNYGVAVHVRRGDYLNLSHIHPNLSVDYYKRAMTYFHKDTEFYFFSDDIDWCEDTFGKRYWYVQNSDPILDWFYMRTFSGFIIANSSYSWWAAYLERSKPVIAPSIWAYNEPPRTIADRLPKEWKAIAP